MNPSEKLTAVASAEDQEIVNVIVNELVRAINARLEEAAEACTDPEMRDAPGIIRSFKVEAKNINVVRA